MKTDGFMVRTFGVCDWDFLTKYGICDTMCTSEDLRAMEESRAAGRTRHTLFLAAKTVLYPKDIFPSCCVRHVPHMVSQ